MDVDYNCLGLTCAASDFAVAGIAGSCCQTRETCAGAKARIAAAQAAGAAATMPSLLAMAIALLALFM